MSVPGDWVGALDSASHELRYDTTIRAGDLRAQFAAARKAITQGNYSKEIMDAVHAARRVIADVKPWRPAS